MVRRIVCMCVIVVLCAAAVGCGDTKVIDGVEYDTCGFIDATDRMNSEIAYEVVWGNVFWGIFLSELLFIPTVYFFGFSLFEPVGRKPEIKGQVPQ